MVINVIYDADIFGEDYIETETYVDLKAEGSAEFSLACESTNLKDAFGNPKIPCLTIYDGPFYLGCFGLVSADLNITVPIEFKIGGSGKIAFEFSGKTGYIYDTANGSRDLSDYSATATAQLSAGFEVQAGPKVGLELQFSRGLLEGELSGGLGLILRGEAACPVVDITTAPKNHACKLCCDVDLSIYYRANASLGIDVSEKLQATLISIDLVSGEYALGKAYISIINDADSIFGGKLAAGEGFCPNYQYRVMIYTENEEQERLSGIPVAVFREGNAKAEGVSPFRTYLYDGDYTGLAYFDSATYPKGFTVDRGPLELTIREQKTILSGTVTDKATGEPIPGAAVRIVWEDDSTLTTTTNAEGCYRFSFYPNGKGSIQFEAENYLPKNTTLSLIAGAENTMDAQLANAYTVTVTVLGLDSGPLGNMPIHGTLLGQSPVTEADGTVSFALPGGSYTLSTYNNVSGAYADIVVDRDLEVTLSLEKNFMAWRFDEPTATLYIWGHGPMGNYYGSAPWEEHKAQIQVVNIKGLRSIGAQAFDKYPAITTVILSDTLETIGYEAFIRCEALKALKLGRGLQAVSDYAFQNCTALTALHLPDSTVTLNNCAFQNCSALAEVTFGEGLRTIGASVFSGSGVTSVILPKTLESTGNYAFSNCASLLDVYIPGCESGTTLCLQSFKDCKALSSVILGENVKTIGGDVFMNCTSLTYLDLGGVTSIGGSAFQSCSSLVALDLPHTLTNIGPSAFGYCSSLGSVAIPSSVTGMGNYAFQHSGMPSVVIPGNGEGLVIPYGAFEHCENLASVEIGNGVTRLANNSFGYCVSLSNLNLGSAVTELGDGAFRGCTGLKALTIPASVRSIGGSTFQDCTALTRIYLPVGLRSIGAAAFSGCTALTGVTIPDTVTLINNYAFSNCTGLRSLLVEGNALGTRVNLGSFQGCKALTSATLGEGVTTLGDNAFPGCESLTSVSLPASLETIGGSAFARTALHSVTIPNQVTGIGGSAFYYCEALSSVTIGSGVESIGPAAFSHTALTSVYVPESVKDIGNYAFERCASLSSVHIAGNPNGTGIHTCAFQWCDALSSVTLGDGVSFIANYAFEFCNKISSVSCSTWGSISIGDRGNDALIKAYGN